MFSVKEKQYLASEIEKLLLNLKHPEMPTERPTFELKVSGKEQWSWATIIPNWVFGDKEAPANPWNEIARQVLPEQGDVDG